MKSVVIVAAKRTPIGSLMGTLSNVKATSLGACAIKGALEESKLKAEEIDQVILGNVISAGIGQAPARQAAIKAGLTHNTICTTINKVCASGMKSVTLGAQSIALGQSQIVVAGGFESMSLTPHYIYYRKGIPYGSGNIVDGIYNDGLLDAYDFTPMGLCAEKTVKDYSISRLAQDDYCELSYKRVKEADFSNEISVVEIENPKTKKLEVIDKDEEPGKFIPEKFRSLKPVFDKNGSITAANSSKINDGGCAIFLADEEFAKSRGLNILARIKAYEDAEIAPVDFSTAPSTGITKLLKNNGLKINDICAFEINEAFASVVLANMKILGINESKVNLNGGAVALGHPIGMSGARIILSLMTVLQKTQGKLGIASICNGGGGSTSILLENMI
jgi:acetyl-CoA C-acetyltransferase